MSAIITVQEKARISYTTVKSSNKLDTLRQIKHYAGKEALR